MRIQSWLLGFALGLIAGLGIPAGGYLALLLLVPAAVWAALEKARPAGLGGSLAGLGAGMAGLLVLANARCAASNVSGPDYTSACVAPDITPWIVAAGVLVAIGLAVSVVATRRDGAPAG